MKPTILNFEKALLFLFIVSFFSCTDSNCIDITKSDKLTKESKQWIVNDTIGNRTLTDNNGFKQTLILTGSDSNYFEKSVEDDCGNSYGSFSYSVQFNTSMMPFNFMVMLNTGSYIENEYDKWPDFNIEFTITRYFYEGNQDPKTKSVKYDIVNNRVYEGNGKSELLETYEINGNTYYNVLKIDFYDSISADDINTVYYAQHYGIISFTNRLSQTFWVE